MARCPCAAPDADDAEGPDDDPHGDSVEVGRSRPRASDRDVTHLQVRFGEAEGLKYLEVVVGPVPADARLPMILGLHGLGDQPRVPTHARIGEGLPYRFIMPWAPERSGHSGFTWLPVRVRDNKVDVLSASLADKAAVLARFLRTLRRERPTVGRPIVTGGSQGGLLAYALAVHHPDIVGAALPVMGWLPPPLVPESVDVPQAYPVIRSVHGTADNNVPIGPTRAAVARLTALGLDVELVEYEGVGHYMIDAMDKQVGGWLVQMVREQLATDRTPAWRDPRLSAPRASVRTDPPRDPSCPSPPPRRAHR
jgi:phospholipase/carboxylesterase